MLISKLLKVTISSKKPSGPLVHGVCKGLGDGLNKKWQKQRSLSAEFATSTLEYSSASMPPRAVDAVEERKKLQSR